MLKLWLDDMRPAPEGWTWCKSVYEAQDVIREYHSIGMFEDASLDNDLGDHADDGGDGFMLVRWMVEKDIWPLNKPTVHSMNPVQSNWMRQDIERYWHATTNPNKV